MAGVRYPEDFRPFDGKRLRNEEIDSLIVDAESSAEGNVATGDILIESSEGVTTIYQAIARSK